MKSYPATSITRLSGEILADAARSPVLITKYRKPGYIIMTAEEYADITQVSPTTKLNSESMRKGKKMPTDTSLDENKQREILEEFAARRISRAEVEERTGLYFSEVLVRMAELGIKRKPVEKYEGMSETQRKLFDEVFRA